VAASGLECMALLYCELAVSAAVLPLSGVDLVAGSHERVHLGLLPDRHANPGRPWRSGTTVFDARRLAVAQAMPASP
jgi:hypothetical protein